MAGIPRNLARQPAPSFGVNYTNNVFSIRSNQVYKAINCHLDIDGTFFTRHGSRKLNSTALNGKVTSVYDYRRPEGSGYKRYILVTAGKKLYKWDEGTSAFIDIADLESSDRPTWATFQDATGGSLALMCNGTEFKSFNGSVVGTISFITDISKPRYILAYDDRLLASGCDSDPYRVFISETLDCTDWSWGSPTSTQYWTVSRPEGDKVTGLGQMYSFGVIFKQFGVDIITGADVTDTATAQISVSSEYGTTSHWSIQTVGNMLYFADESHVYRAMLREAVENGLLVRPIEDNVRNKYKNIKDVYDIVSVYDPKNKEIIWGLNTKVGIKKDTGLVYSIGNSGDKGALGWVDIWSGWFENGVDYEPYTLAIVLDSNNKPVVYRGDEDGSVYVMDERIKFKDDSADIQSEIFTGAIAPQGHTVGKRLRNFSPALFQRYDNSTTVQWVIDGSYVKPSTARSIILKNLVPYWRDSADTVTSQAWNTTVWNTQPYTIRPITCNSPFRYVQFHIVNDGSNDRDEIAYAGNEVIYQNHGNISRRQG